MRVHVVLLQTVMSEVTGSVWTEQVTAALGAWDNALQSSHTIHE